MVKVCCPFLFLIPADNSFIGVTVAKKKLYHVGRVNRAVPPLPCELSALTFVKYFGEA